MPLKLREEKGRKTSQKNNPLSQGSLSTELTTTSEEGAGVIVKALLMRPLDIVAT